MTKTHIGVLSCGYVLAGLSAAVSAQMSWTEAATTGPTARRAHAMAHDSQRGRTVLFGGMYVTHLGHTALGDTWEWNGAAWAELAPASPRPAPRSYSAMVYDRQNGRTVLFGGSSPSGTGSFSDTWAWDGSTWLLLAATGPARHWHGMVYDSLRDRIVMFGGATFGGTWFGDTWEWDGVSWTQVSTTGPGVRIQPAMAYDSQRGVTVLFGGRDLTGDLGDTWEWDGSTWTQVATTGPSPRYDTAMVYDSQRDTTVLFGGLYYPAPLGSYALGDTWEWAGGVWTQVATPGPGTRAGHEMIYDSPSQRVVLFGGFVPTSGWEILFGNTWERGPFDSTAVTFGEGCGVPRLALSPIANARPAIDTTAQAALLDIPSAQAFIALGWDRTMFQSHLLPYSLAGYGMPGCSLLHSADTTAGQVTFTGPAAATFDLPIPNWPGLIGLHVYVQGWAHAPFANPGDVIVSNGLDWLIGGS